MIGKAIYEVMVNDSNISSYLGDKIYPIVVPQDVEFPAATYFTASSTPDKTKSKKSTINNATIQIKVMHANMNSSKIIGEYVRQAFDNLSGEVATIKIDTTKYEGSTMLFDEDAGVFMNIITLNFFYKYTNI